MSIEEIKALLPVKWSDVTLEQYIKLKELLPATEDVENYRTLTIDAFVYVFTNVRLIDLKLTTPEVLQISNIVFNIQADDYDIDTTVIKTIDEIEYESFITFVKYQTMNSIKFYNRMIALMLNDGTKAEDILNWSMSKVNGFFLHLLIELNQYLERSKHSLRRKMKITMNHQ